MVPHVQAKRLLQMEDAVGCRRQVQVVLVVVLAVWVALVLAVLAVLEVTPMSKQVVSVLMIGLAMLLRNLNHPARRLQMGRLTAQQEERKIAQWVFNPNAILHMANGMQRLVHVHVTLVGLGRVVRISIAPTTTKHLAMLIVVPTACAYKASAFVPLDGVPRRTLLVLTFASMRFALSTVASMACAKMVRALVRMVGKAQLAASPNARMTVRVMALAHLPWQTRQESAIASMASLPLIVPLSLYTRSSCHAPTIALEMVCVWTGSAFVVLV
jgi:hypothetical protein